MDAQKNRLIETVLLSTHNICFGREIKKIVFQNTLIWRPDNRVQMGLDETQHVFRVSKKVSLKPVCLAIETSCLAKEIC